MPNEGIFMIAIWLRLRCWNGYNKWGYTGRNVLWRGHETCDHLRESILHFSRAFRPCTPLYHVFQRFVGSHLAMRFDVGSWRRNSHLSANSWPICCGKSKFGGNNKVGKCEVVCVYLLKHHFSERLNFQGFSCSLQHFATQVVNDPFLQILEISVSNHGVNLSNIHCISERPLS